ncbi:MAG: hypothetical protein AAF747_03075 [Planctomycetota bacterium]
MPDRLFRLYQRRRVINLNTNIVAAGLLSTLLVMAIVWLMKRAGLILPTWGFTTTSIVLDIVLDVAIFTGLHWVANHWRPLRGKHARERAELAAAPPPFVQDTAQLQVERAVISPLYYLLAGGMTEILQRLSWSPVWAIALAYPAALLVTRVVHTTWGLRSGTHCDHHKREQAESDEGTEPRRSRDRHPESGPIVEAVESREHV